MSCSYSEAVVGQVISFHGHSCPGLAIGIRAAESAKRRFPDSASANLVCITETDMCGVDAIQYLTGCTFGKGNLIHRDYGKMAFTFYDRSASGCIRLVLKEQSRAEGYAEMTELMGRSADGSITPPEQQRLVQLREASTRRLMEIPLEEVFDITEMDQTPPRPARVMASLVCESCHEKTMESRTRRFAGKTMCIPCFRAVEQKQ